MGEPFLGEIRLVAFNYAPRGWASANGQLLPINQNQALYALCGNTYGGDGVTNFALPDLRGRVPVHMGDGYTRGQRVGEPTHTLTSAEMPTHTHTVAASSLPADLTAPADNMQFATFSDVPYFCNSVNAPQVPTPGAFGSAGGGQAHENMQPYLTLNFCVALQGIFPSQN